MVIVRLANHAHLPEMVRRSGSADLPLHGGRVPPWLASRMAQLGAVICEAIVNHYGRDEFLRRLAHPFWFQSFGAVMGMDWHSSGITTSVIGALKRGLTPLGSELGIYVCGGRGKHSRKTPDELKRSANVSASMVWRSHALAAWSPRWTVQPFRMGLISTCTGSSLRATGSGPS